MSIRCSTRSLTALEDVCRPPDTLSKVLSVKYPRSSVKGHDEPVQATCVIEPHKLPQEIWGNA